jgi:hypothetical protein
MISDRGILISIRGTGSRDVDGRLFEFSTRAREQRCQRILALIIHPLADDFRF